ncbi:hypothetical protein [Virgibacillus dakarensis]|nr:hypothetical protein [Virgibacillus dakarensis]
MYYLLLPLLYWSYDYSQATANHSGVFPRYKTSMAALTAAMLFIFPS